MSVENPFTEIVERLDRIELLLKVTTIIPPLVEKPDRITDIDEACKVIGGDDNPVSRAFVYGETHHGTIPHEKFGSRLIFSRKKLIAWRDARTAGKNYPETIINDRLAASAKKKLRK